jgi:molecular chaperone DnaK (HSP70)
MHLIATKIPIIFTMIDYLPGTEILNSIPPDEVIAIGAAKQVHTMFIYRLHFIT